MQNPRESRITDLIVEFPVRVLAKECLSNGRESVDLQKPQTLLESVVNFDLAFSADNDHTTSAIIC
jgi:hypothetical protein